MTYARELSEIAAAVTVDGSKNVSVAEKIVVTKDSTISGLTVGKGGGAVSGNTVVGSGVLTNSGNTGGLLQAFGYVALASNTTGVHNDAFGAFALNGNTTGSFNSGIGTAALSGNTTGSNNVAVGKSALQSNTTASHNTAIGYQAGYSGTTAQYNTFVGMQAGYGITTGSRNTFVGNWNSGSVGSGSAITTGSANTILGAYSGNAGGLDIRTASNYIVLSDGDGNPRQVINASGQFLLNTATSPSNSMFTAVGGGQRWEFGPSNTNTNFVVVTPGAGSGVYIANNANAWSSVSDERKKENLIPITDALNKVLSLRAITGNYISDVNKTSNSFLIAQDVQKVLPEAVDVQDDEEKTLGLRYTDTIPLLVAAIQELKAQVEAQALEIATLKGL